MTALTKFIATALAMLSPCTTLAANSNTVTIEDMKNYLIDVGVPKTHIACLDDVKIETMYERFNDKYIYNNGTEISYLNVTNDGDLVPYSGEIKDSDMTLTLTTLVMCYDNETKEIDTVFVYIEYEWLNIPFVVKEDAAIVNWDSNAFTYVADFFGGYNIATYTAVGNPNVYQDATYMHQPTILLQDSLGYIIDLPNPGSRIDKLYGHADFELIPAHNPMYLCEADNLPSSYNTTSVNVQYRHNGNPLWQGVGISVSGVSITFDSDWLTYTTARASNIYYRY